MSRPKKDIHWLMEGSDDSPPCNPEIYEKGTCVAVITEGTARLIERFVREVAEYSGQPVDWHYMGGRGRVLTTGDAEKVRQTIEAMRMNIRIRGKGDYR
jgi:hypothetical protein